MNQSYYLVYNLDLKIVQWNMAPSSVVKRMEMIGVVLHVHMNSIRYKGSALKVWEGILEEA